MVEFEDDAITDDQADAMALARAFQAATVSCNEKREFSVRNNPFDSWRLISLLFGIVVI